MLSSSRRSFLRGRRLASEPWAQFRERLRRTVSGEFVEFRSDDRPPSARLTLHEVADIHHVLALCKTYGVVLALDGLTAPAATDDRPLLWVRPGRKLAGLERLDVAGERWFVQPGCTLGQLADAGLRAFAAWPAHINVATWLADRTLVDYGPGASAGSGLVHASLLLGDGTSVGLGPFGTTNTRPLQGLRLQQMVPELFQLVRSPEAVHCLQADFWPARYRLDALVEQPGQTLNLAHLCLGHGGTLGWLEWLVLDADQVCSPGEPAEWFGAEAVEAGGWGDAAFYLDARVKMLFDPDGIFPGTGQDL